MTLTDGSNEVKLDNLPTECISSIKFGLTSSQFLLASSWDGSVRLYDVTNNSMRLKYTHQNAVLDCTFQDAVHSFSGGLDGQLKRCDLNSSTETSVGSHNATIRCVEYCSETNVIITGSWDQTVKLWDPRMSNTCAVTTVDTYDKVYTMAVCGDKLVVGTAGRRVFIYDLKNNAYLEQRRESSLKYQTRCIRCFPNKQGYVLSSIEGRVAVEYLDPSPDIQKKKYAFKCHRIKDSNGVELIYPVNAIAFHDTYNTFATGGSDGYVNIWDGFKKKRLCQFHRYPTSISSLAFSPDGNQLAIASSFLHEMDTKEYAPDSIFIRTVTDTETKPK